MAECIAKRILEMELENAAGYVLLSNIYAAVGNRHLCENVEWQGKEKGVKKQLGQNFFVVEDQDHPQMIEMHDVGPTYLVRNSFCMMSKKKKRYFICVTIVRNLGLA
jgi:hypothetical protein